MSSIRSVERTKLELAGHGIRLETGVVRYGLLDAATEHARAALSSRLSATLDGLRFAGWLTKRHRVSNLQLSLVGCPAWLFEDWRKVTADVGERFEIAHANAQWQDRLFGRLRLDGVRQRTTRDGYLFEVDALSVGQTRWRGILLEIKRPKSALEIRTAQSGESRSSWELRYVPSAGVAAEWSLHVSSQPMRGLLQRLGSGSVEVPERMRGSGVISMTVPDDETRRMTGSLQFVMDEWLQPTWPDSAALVGRSGSVGARIVVADDSQTWELSRVEIAAGPFSLLGKGKLEFVPFLRLEVEARGTETCRRLAVSLAPSKYRDQVRAHIERSGAPSDSVALQVRVAVDGATGEAPRIAWHLSSGCGLEALSSTDVQSEWIPGRPLSRPATRVRPGVSFVR
jgi:hypothetical protein